LVSGGVTPLWDGAVAAPFKETPSHICYHVKFHNSPSKAVSRSRKEPTKCGVALRWGRGDLSRFQGHSRSSEQTQIDLWLPITFHNKHRPIWYRFRDKRRFQLKITNFP